MERKTGQETVERVGPSGCEINAESVSTYVFHLVLVWKRRNCARRIFFAQCLVEEYKVCEASSDSSNRFLK